MEDNVFSTKLLGVVGPSSIISQTQGFTEIYLIMELGESDLYTLLETCPEQRLKEKHVIKLFYGLLCCL